MSAGGGSSRRLVIAAGGLVVAVVASRILGAASFRTATVAWSQASQTWLGYLAVWLPLGAAVAAVVVPALRATPRPSSAATLGLARWFSWRDLIWGCAAGLVARGLATLVSVALTGYTGLGAVPTLGGPPPAALLVVMVVAPVVVAPVVEELFFRGLLQGALTSVFAVAGASPGEAARPGAAPGGGVRADAAPGGTVLGGAALGGTVRADALSRWTAAAIAAAVFAALHLLVAPGDPVALTLASTFVLGLFAGGLVASSGRIGGAVVAHVVFNGVAVWLTWPR